MASIIEQLTSRLENVKCAGVVQKLGPVSAAGKPDALEEQMYVQIKSWADLSHVGLLCAAKVGTLSRHLGKLGQHWRVTLVDDLAD